MASTPPRAPDDRAEGKPGRSEIRSAARGVVERASHDLVALSHAIWDHPELAFEEVQASARCSEVLDRAGFRVNQGVADLPTSFVAEYGSGPLVVGICSELDALPDVGHACGHNIIAASGVGAGLALARIADDLGITVRVFGTPAEEAGGGKILMAERGAFDGTHLAMMVHPANEESDACDVLASNGCTYKMHGRTSHASSDPHKGINAADALTIAQVAVGLLRQHLEPGCQVHGIVTKGGAAANIVPGYAEASFMMRAPTIERLLALEPRIHRCFEAGALAAGARLEYEVEPTRFSEFRNDEALVGWYRANAEALGREFPANPNGGGSTDMANLSLLMPVIHPMLALDCGPWVNHQPEFAACCRNADADKTLLDGAIGLAWTAIDAALDDAARVRFLAADTAYGHRARYPWTAP